MLKVRKNEISLRKWSGGTAHAQLRGNIVEGYMGMGWHFESKLQAQRIKHSCENCKGWGTSQRNLRFNLRDERRDESPFGVQLVSETSVE